jgi:hypothetical protein
MVPGCVMMATKLLLKHIHIGGTGGTVFPFAVRAIASKKGVEVLQPIIFALVVVLVGLWAEFSED